MKIVHGHFTSKRLVFAAGVLSLFLEGCSSSLPASNPSGVTAAPLAAGGAATVYVVQDATVTSVAVLGLSTKVSGSVTPSILTVGSGNFRAYGAVASDNTGHFYVAGVLPDGTEYLKVFAAGATGQAATVNSFAPDPQNTTITALTTDSAANLFIAGAGAVNIFPSSASVINSQAAHSITLPSGQVPIAVSVDGLENIYVACNSSGTGSSGAVFVYALQSNGTIALLRTITINAFLAGVTASSTGNIFVVENTSGTNAAGVANTETVAEFAAGASGAAAPVKTIFGSLTGMTFGGAVTLDTVGNLYLVNISVAGTTQTPVTTPSVLIFGPTASGDEPPAVTLTSAAWTAPSSQLTVQ